MHINKEDLPVALEAPGTKIMFKGGFGGNVITYYEMPAGSVNKALFEGLPGNDCHCPHWGYILKGEMTVHYANGGDETVREGDLYYFPAGHTAAINKDIIFVEISPEKEYMEVMDVVGQNMQTMGNGA